MSSRSMRSYWDRRASEDAFYFVDNRRRYRADELEQFWWGGEEVLDQLLDSLGVTIEPTTVVVEIGCGVGRITRGIAARSARVLAVDVAPRMLELAAEHNTDLDNVEWILGDGESLAPIADASVDVCFSHVVFQHIPDPKITLAYVGEMGRVLRPGGWAAFQVSNDFEIHRARPWIERLRSLPGRALGRRPRGQSHVAWLGSAVDLGELTAAAEASGCRVARVNGEGTQWCMVLLFKGDNGSD